MKHRPRDLLKFAVLLPLAVSFGGGLLGYFIAPCFITNDLRPSALATKAK